MGLCIVISLAIVPPLTHMVLFSMLCCSQNLQNSRGQQRDVGDGQRERHKKNSPTASDEDNVILSAIKNRGIQGQEYCLTH